MAAAGMTEQARIAADLIGSEGPAFPMAVSADRDVLGQ
jgi:hypothetical protein